MIRLRKSAFRKVAVLTLLGLGSLLDGGGFAQALECPVPHPVGTQTAIQQTGESIRAYKNLLAAQGTGAISEIIAQLRQGHPKVTTSEITNLLVTVYYPVLNENASLDDAQNRACLMEFSSRVMQKQSTDK